MVIDAIDKFTFNLSYFLLLYEDNPESKLLVFYQVYTSSHFW